MEKVAFGNPTRSLPASICVQILFENLVSHPSGSRSHPLLSLSQAPPLVGWEMRTSFTWVSASSSFLSFEHVQMKKIPALYLLPTLKPSVITAKAFLHNKMSILPLSTGVQSIVVAEDATYSRQYVMLTSSYGL